MEKEKSFLSTREVAEILDVNEKMIYTLITDKGLPATKVTGKWLFPKALVEQWLDSHIINYPKTARLPPSVGILIIAGSHDILLEKAIGLFNRLHSDHLAVFGNVGSLGGLRALGSGTCHIAASHLLQDDEKEYNFDFAHRELRGNSPAIVNFCRREQGLLVAKENPKAIRGVSDLGKPGIRIANRPEGTGTRLLLDHELEKADLKGTEIEGYKQEFRGHMDVGLEVLSGRADASLAIRPVAQLLDLDFIPLRWERYDLLISKDRFFEHGVQLFLGILHESVFRNLSDGLEGYDLSLCGKVVFPQGTKSDKPESK
ncbi:MAG: helix-turn-helix transcriptional regulator [Deltaproteobacteria bacterium]|nr:helix-turn-helix transcriptional regulator [Deltaproteobacteria bacterium]